jgi:hypothetical protein
MANNIVFLVDEYLQQPNPAVTGFANLLAFNLNDNRIKGNSSYISVATGAVSNIVQLTGTVKGLTSSNTIVGQSSIFDLELSPGDRIRVTGFTNNTVVRVHSITGAQTMIVTPRPPVSFSTAANAYIRKLETKSPERFKIGANGHTIALKSLTVAKNLKVVGNTSIDGTISMSSSFRRNRIINGNMLIWQRGTSQSSPGNPATYGSVDRWFFQSGTTSVSISRSTSVPSGFLYSVKVQRDVATSGVQPISMGQIIESVNCYDLSNQTVTLSFWAKAGAYFSAVDKNLTATIYTGTSPNQGNAYVFPISSRSWTGGATPGNGTYSLTTTWTRYTLTATLGPGVLETLINFSYTPSGGASADDAFYITGVQLELGSVTSYEFTDYGEQLAQCQRYLPVIQAGLQPTYIAPTIARDATSFEFHYNFKVTPRIPPTSLATTLISGFAFCDSVSVTTVTGFSSVTANYDSALVIGTVASGLTAFRPGSLQLSSTSQILFNGCEL